MKTEMPELNLPEEPKPVLDEESILFVYRDFTGTREEVMRLYERDCCETYRKGYEELANLVRQLLSNDPGALKQTCDNLAESVVQYRSQLEDHRQLGGDYEVSPEVAIRSADRVRESEAALDKALSAYRKLTATKPDYAWYEGQVDHELVRHIVKLRRAASEQGAI